MSNISKVFGFVFFFSFLFAKAQTNSKKNKNNDDGSANDFPELIMTKINGAPLLGKPSLVMGDEGPLTAGGMGWAAPLMFDWNGDGKRDLLIGEFVSGIENPNHLYVGNFMRVYLNKGTDTMPKFTNDFSYAKPEQGQGFGTPMSIYSFCCIGFTPQVVDLNNDGLPDIVSGQYLPGGITWFKAIKPSDKSDGGFMSGTMIKQEGDEGRYANEPLPLDLPTSDIRSFWYWTYSSAAFGDLDGDGKYDLILGGSALRSARNTGTKEEPQFGVRKLLLDLKGQPLKTYTYNEEELRTIAKAEYSPPESGSEDLVPVVVDWDNDGILDILATDNYLNKGYHAIMFFKGVKTDSGLRFQQGVSLFDVKDNGKAFPGSWLRLCVTDWNHDGINDLLVGTAICMFDGKFDHHLSWTWEADNGTIKKDPAYYSKDQKLKYDQQIAEAPLEKKNPGDATKQFLQEAYYGKNNYTTLAHVGYVYLMLGKKNQ